MMEGCGDVMEGCGDVMEGHSYLFSFLIAG